MGLVGIISSADYATSHSLQEAQLFNSTRLTSRYQTPQAHQDEWSGLGYLTQPNQMTVGQGFSGFCKLLTKSVFFTNQHANMNLKFISSESLFKTDKSPFGNRRSAVTQDPTQVSHSTSHEKKTGSLFPHVNRPSGCNALHKSTTLEGRQRC